MVAPGGEGSQKTQEVGCTAPQKVEVPVVSAIRPFRMYLEFFHWTTTLNPNIRAPLCGRRPLLKCMILDKAWFWSVKSCLGVTKFDLSSHDWIDFFEKSKHLFEKYKNTMIFYAHGVMWIGDRHSSVCRILGFSKTPGPVQ